MRIAVSMTAVSDAARQRRRLRAVADEEPAHHQPQQHARQIHRETSSSLTKTASPFLWPPNPRRLFRGFRQIEARVEMTSDELTVGGASRKASAQATFCRQRKAERLGIASHPDETKLDALIKLELACELALEALPQLPNQTEQALRDPVEHLCTVTGAELDRISPDWRSRRVVS